VDAARRTVEVWCEIPNGKRELRGNVFGNVVIHTGNIPDGLVVPLAAVQFEEGTSKGTVFVADEKKVAHKSIVQRSYSNVFSGVQRPGVRYFLNCSPAHKYIVLPRRWNRSRGTLS
jgi:multidrug efflux pump subunit AcrA (membrane-fusion protein)